MAGLILTSSLLAALISGAITVWLSGRRTRMELRAQARTMCAEAFQWYAAYKEFPYAVRRRRPDQPESERQRLSEQLRLVQERLTFYLAWTKTLDEEIGKSYAQLVADLRRIAGGAIREAWNSDPCELDSKTNIPAEVLDLSALRHSEDAYIDAVVSRLRE